MRVGEQQGKLGLSPQFQSGAAFLGSEGGTEPACGVRGLSRGRAGAGVWSRGREQGCRARTRAVLDVYDHSFQRLQDRTLYM